MKETQGARPFMMNFIIKEESLAEPSYNETTQLHDVSDLNEVDLANFASTAIPNHRDTM